MKTLGPKEAERRALRERKNVVGRNPAPRLSRADVRIAPPAAAPAAQPKAHRRPTPIPDQKWAVISASDRPRAEPPKPTFRNAQGKFDRNAYMRDFMVGWRKRQKEK